MKRTWSVTIYNQHAQRGVSATGPSRPKAFAAAISKAGEPFLREGGDKLSTLRTLFAEMYRANRHTARCYRSHPNGAGVDWRLLNTEI